MISPMTANPFYGIITRGSGLRRLIKVKFTHEEFDGYNDPVHGLV